MCLQIRTFDLQLAGHGGLSLGVLGSAGVHTTIEAAGLTDLQGANALIRDLTKLGVVTNDHLILQPLDLRLRGGGQTIKNSPSTRRYLLICETSADLRGTLEV